jgi:hypothetical protein
MPNDKCQESIDLIRVGGKCPYHNRCDPLWEKGTSGKNEHIFNNVGGVVFTACTNLEKKIAIDTKPRHVQQEHKRLIQNLKNSCTACIVKTGHKKNTVDGIKAVGDCRDTRNTRLDDDRSFADLSKRIHTYIETITFDNIEWHTKNTRDLEFMLTNDAEIRKRVIDQGAYYSARIILRTTIDFDKWFKTTESIVISFLKGFSQTIWGLRRNIVQYYK